ncbi:TasA family protein [Paenibacillus silvisoli]|uniref:TasA family protein n=1 Tax=Paenibacillus silvisoli TaxID=3110539 RepID=UPI002806071E|nr:TasA family protein [Paenibacillus silvisoli]
MNMKKKMLALSLSSAVLLTAAIGGGTYALFTSKAANTENTFAAGTLSVSSHRNDVPVEGPMFYTNDTVAGGLMGTGLWAPRDVHTRALLIKNTGSLDAKLKYVKAIPEGTSAEQATALEFGSQAIATVAALTTSNGEVLDATAIDIINSEIDATFKDLISGNFFERIAAVGIQAAFAEISEALLDATYTVDNNGHSVTVGVSDIYVGKLSDLASGQSAILPNLVLKAGQTMHLGYTVLFLDDVNNNAIQNKTVKFTFDNQFEQAANN